jgi:Icc-related predicted phosphoesterase
MLPSFFVADLHGRTGRYLTLFDLVRREGPRGVFFGGDLLPHGMDSSWTTAADQTDFLTDFLLPELRRLRSGMGGDFPQMFFILGNDDPGLHAATLQGGEQEGLLHYVHGGKAGYGPFTVYGYACIPPSPFLLKDWERYDVSRFVDPGCIAPEDGRRTIGPGLRTLKNTTIANELALLAGEDDLTHAICLFHCPPYGGVLDRAALDGKMVDHVPLDVHIGSIAIQRFIADRQPLLTLHGHVHESFTLTGKWQETSGRTLSLSAATERPELALVRFDPHRPEGAALDFYPPSSS